MSARAAGPGGTNPEGAPAGPAAAEIYLRLIAEAELRQRPVISGPGPHPHRVWLAAATLAAVGALGPDVAWHVVSEFEASAGLRGGDVRPVISSLHRPHWARQTRAGQHRGRQGAGEAGAGHPGTSPAGDQPDAPSAIQIGAMLSLPPEQEGWYGEFCLLSLARTESQAALAVAARWAGQTRRTAGPRPRHAPFHQVGAVDDRGVSYRAALWDMGAEDGRDWWDCHLGLDPAPPPDTRWLEVGPGAQGQRVRIDLATPPGRAQTLTEPVPPVSPAARLLDQMGDDLLTLESARAGSSIRVVPRVTQVIQDLIGSGTLPAGDPAVARLAGLGWRLGLDLGPAARSRPVHCPPRGSACWPTGTRTTGRTRLRRSRPTCRRSTEPGSRSWIAIDRRRRDTARDGQRLGAPGTWPAGARQRSGRHPAGPFAVLAGPRVHRPLASGQWHELGGGLADPGDDQDVPDSPAAPGGHGPRRVRDRTPPSGPGDGPAQVVPGRNPRRPARAARGLPHPPPVTGPGQ